MVDWENLIGLFGLGLVIFVSYIGTLNQCRVCLKEGTLGNLLLQQRCLAPNSTSVAETRDAPDVIGVPQKATCTGASRPSARKFDTGSQVVSANINTSSLEKKMEKNEAPVADRRQRERLKDPELSHRG